MKLEFYKYQGTGNDFVIFNNMNGEIPALNEEQVSHICNRKFGIGADGLMLLNKKEGYDFEMIYYNADGHQSTMCGNGGRCLVKFAYHRGIHRNEYHFLAIDGGHEAEIDVDGTVSLKMQNVKDVQHFGHHAILNTGSPHYIQFSSEVKDINVPVEGRTIRYSEEFASEGINVNFIETIDDDTIFVRTYERGVEDETLSCGTGVTAAALVSAHNDNGFNQVNVKTPGGRLTVEFDKIDDEHFENIWLCGPAEFVYSGQIEI